MSKLVLIALQEWLIYGGYPELMHLRDQVDKVDYLSDMLSSYLLKDILAYENIKNSQKILIYFVC